MADETTNSSSLWDRVLTHTHTSKWTLLCCLSSDSVEAAEVTSSEPRDEMLMGPKNKRAEIHLNEDNLCLNKPSACHTTSATALFSCALRRSRDFCLCNVHLPSIVSRHIAVSQSNLAAAAVAWICSGEILPPSPRLMFILLSSRRSSSLSPAGGNAMCSVCFADFRQSLWSLEQNSLHTHTHTHKPPARIYSAVRAAQCEAGLRSRVTTDNWVWVLVIQNDEAT